jgi:hypothetical protein
MNKGQICISKTLFLAFLRLKIGLFPSWTVKYVCQK